MISLWFEIRLSKKKEKKEKKALLLSVPAEHRRESV